MNKVDDTFFEKYCTDNFAEFVSDIQLELEKSNSTYNKYIKQRRELLDKYPNIRNVIENNDYVSLSSKEVKMLSDYISLMDNCSTIFERELFLRGMKEAYSLFKKMKIIK